MNVGSKIRIRRKELRLTLQEVADYVGVSKPAVHKWENNVILNLKIDKLERLAEILKVDPLWFIDENYETEQKNDDFTDLEKEIISLVKALDFKEQLDLYYQLKSKKEGK